jgi:hypothetical protein
VSRGAADEVSGSNLARYTRYLRLDDSRRRQQADEGPIEGFKGDRPGESKKPIAGRSRYHRSRWTMKIATDFDSIFAIGAIVVSLAQSIGADGGRDCCSEI